MLPPTFFFYHRILMLLRFLLNASKTPRSNAPRPQRQIKIAARSAQTAPPKPARPPQQSSRMSFRASKPQSTAQSLGPNRRLISWVLSKTLRDRMLRQPLACHQTSMLLRAAFFRLCWLQGNMMEVLMTERRKLTVPKRMRRLERKRMHGRERSRMKGESASCKALQMT